MKKRWYSCRNKLIPATDKRNYKVELENGKRKAISIETVMAKRNPRGFTELYYVDKQIIAWSPIGKDLVDVYNKRIGA